MKAVKHIIEDLELIKTNIVTINNAFFNRLKKERVKSVQYICIILSYENNYIHQ